MEERTPRGPHTLRRRIVMHRIDLANFEVLGSRGEDLASSVALSLKTAPPRGFHLVGRRKEQA